MHQLHQKEILDAYVYFLYMSFHWKKESTKIIQFTYSAFVVNIVFI